LRKERVGIQLAYPATQSRVAALGKKFLAQPKLNGERARIYWIGNDPVFISSYGNEFYFLDHLKQELQQNKMFHGYLLDGEIYVHGWSRERIDSALRRKKNISEDVGHLEYHVFDLAYSNVCAIERAYLLQDLNWKPNMTAIFRVPTYSCATNQWVEFCSTFVKQGYEGVILRSHTGLYAEKRTADMLKYKPTKKDVYLIVGVKEGTNRLTGMLGSFLVRGHDGTEFSVGTGPELTDEKRQKYWQIKDTLIGRKLVVKHEEITTSGGKPICTVAVELKDL
jgi:ATP-dependent DNA ligase